MRAWKRFTVMITERLLETVKKRSLETVKTRVPGLRKSLARMHGPENTKNHFGVEGGDQGLKYLRAQIVTPRRRLVHHKFHSRA